MGFCRQETLRRSGDGKGEECSEVLGSLSIDFSFGHAKCGRDH